MDKVAIQQMNDYAMTKWVNEMQIRNSELLNETQTVRVRLFNTYGPGEHYSRLPERHLFVLLPRAPRASLHGVFEPHPHLHLHRRRGACSCGDRQSFQRGKGLQHRRQDNSRHQDRFRYRARAYRRERRFGDLQGKRKSSPHDTSAIDITKAERDLGLIETVTLKDGIERNAQVDALRLRRVVLGVSSRGDFLLFLLGELIALRHQLDVLQRNQRTPMRWSRLDRSF